MSKVVVPRRAFVVLISVALGGCSSSQPPPATAPLAPAATSASAVAAVPSAEPEPAPPEETKAVDYGAPPKTKCIPPNHIAEPPNKSLEERKAQRFRLAKKILDVGALYIELDARKPGSTVPPKYEVSRRLVLVVGYDLPKPIPDLKVDEKGVSGTLSFKKKPFFVNIPWDVVHGMQDEDRTSSWYWKEDVPPDALCSEGASDEEPVLEEE